MIGMHTDGEDKRGDTRSTLLFAVEAAIALSAALMMPDDYYHAAKLIAVTIALAAMLFAVGRVTVAPLERAGPKTVAWLICFVAAFEIAGTALSPPRLGPDVTPYIPFVVLLVPAALCAALTLPAMFTRSRVFRQLQAAAFVTLLALFVVTGDWIIRAAPFSAIDVYVIQTDSAEALLHGTDPYAITFPDLSFGTSTYYAPGVQQNNRLMFGYVYMPLSLLMATGGQLFGNDVRYASVFCIGAAAAVIGFGFRGRFAKPAAALLLMMPSGFLMIREGFTEPYVLLFVALAIVTAARRPRWTPWCLGLLFALKQYVPLLAPLSLLLLPRPWTRKMIFDWAWRAMLIGAAVTLPFVLWNPSAFWWSAVRFQLMLQPFRDDSLSYFAAVHRVSGIILPSMIGLALLATLLWLAIRRAPRTQAGFAIAFAAGLLVFFAFSRQAFVNYYFLMTAAACCAVAAATPPWDEPEIE